MDLDINSLHLLSFFAICKESLRIVLSWRKYQVCRTSLLFVSCLSLGIPCFSMFILSFRFAYEYQKNSMDFSAIVLSQLKSKWVIYLELILVLPYLYLHSVSSAVYSVAWIFSGKEEILSHNDTKKIIQSVSKRILTTFLWSVAITGPSILLGGFLAFFCVFSDCFRLVGAVILILNFIGFVYISSVSHLALVVSILEDVHGLEAFVRSNSLIRGKLGLASAIFLLGFSSAAIIIVLLSFFYYFVFSGGLLASPLVIALSVVVQVLGLVVSAMAILFHLVAETIVYFVCKPYQEDDLEKFVSADYLTSFLNEVNASIPSMADGGEAGTNFSWQEPLKVFLIIVGMVFTMVVILSKSAN